MSLIYILEVWFNDIMTAIKTGYYKYKMNTVGFFYFENYTNSHAGIAINKY